MLKACGYQKIYKALNPKVKLKMNNQINCQFPDWLIKLLPRYSTNKKKFTEFGRLISVFL